MSWDDDVPSERLPPHNAEAEEAVIGSVLLDKFIMGELAEILAADDFYHERNGVIWAAMLTLHERQEPVDWLLLMDELERSGKMTAAGGVARLGGFLGVVPTPIHAVYYAKIIVHAATMRRLVSAGGKVATLGFQNAISDAQEAVERAVAFVQDVLPPARAGRGPTELKDALEDYLGYMEAVKEGDPAASLSVPSGIADFDTRLGGGMQRSDFIILGARPSMGKTAFCLNVMRNLASVHDGSGLMFSLEMPIQQIVGRLLALESGVQATTIRNGVYTDVEVRRVGLAITKLMDAHLYVDDQEGLSITQIRERARRLHAQHALDFIAVDHLQLVQAGGRSRDQNRTEQISEITRQLKNMARELRVPVMALSQLSRAVEQRSGKKIPELRDLRESGSSEQDADVVAFLYRDSYYDKDSERQGVADVIIAKHRNGETGQFSLIFDQRTMRFLDIEPRY